MNALLDDKLLRATSAEHAIECATPSGARLLELIDVTEEEPVGVVSYASTRWERLDLEKATIVFASSSAIDRVGVTTYYAGKHVSYRECSIAEAKEAMGNFQRAGFSGPKSYEVK